MVPEGHEKGEDRFGRALSIGCQGDDWTWILYLILGVLFAPILVCMKLLLNYLFVRSALPLEKVETE